MTRAFPRAAMAAASVVVALPDPDDIHIVGTALAAEAPVIVTYNLMDFPAKSLNALGLRAVHPDSLASEMLGSQPDAVVAVLIEHARALRRPPTTLQRLLATLDGRGLHAFAAAAREELAKRG